MIKRSYYIVNGITSYRLLAAPILIVLIFLDKIELFKWLLAVSFFTDMVDGYLARKFKVISRFGARLDSIADDFTIVAAIVGVFVLKPGFIKEEMTPIIILLALFLIENAYALIKYRKASSFHTYLAKVAALLQGTFLILIFFLPQPLYALFYAAFIVTALDLIEEIILIFLLPKWETNVKGLYWVMSKRKKKNRE
jgi:phosphatidylglycerophosphate synthase